MGLSKAAMSGIARDLISLGVLHETETVYGQGRPSILLDLYPEGAFFVGISLLEDPAPMVLSDLNGKIIARETMPLSRDPEIIASLVADALPKLLAGQPDAAGKLSGLGVALSGFVDEKQANCVQSTLLGWQDVPLARIIHEKTGIETFIENDAKAVAVSEKLFGSARDILNFSVVSFGDGIGCAHFIGGKLYRGNHGGAGEIAHCTIERARGFALPLRQARLPRHGRLDEGNQGNVEGGRPCLHVIDRAGRRGFGRQCHRHPHPASRRRRTWPRDRPPDPVQ